MHPHFSQLWTEGHEFKYDVNMTEIEWETAGVSSAKFGLDRPLRAGEYFAPEDLEVRGQDWLLWSPEAAKRVRPGTGTFQKFVELADAPTHEILKYARRWGVLEICEHGLPACHDGCVPLDLGKKFYDPVGVWRRFAALFRAMLNIAAQLHQGKPGRPEDWQIVAGPPLSLATAPLFQRRGLAVDRDKLVVALNVLLSIGRVRPVVTWREGKWAIEFTGGLRIMSSLFGALVYQLMLAVTQTEGCAMCSNCAQSYFPERRPNPYRRNYCPSCRDRGVPSRDAARDRRARLSGKGESW